MRRPRFYRRVFYVDEDAWQITQEEVYDKKGTLERPSDFHMIQYYDVQVPWYTAAINQDQDQQVPGDLPEQRRALPHALRFMGQMNDYIPSRLRSLGLRVRTIMTPSTTTRFRRLLFQLRSRSRPSRSLRRPRPPRNMSPSPRQDRRRCWKTTLTLGTGFRAGTPQTPLVGAGAGQTGEFRGRLGRSPVNDDAQLNFPKYGDLFTAP